MDAGIFFFFLQMRIITNATGAGGEWSDPEPLFLDFPLPRKHNTQLI
jgi:hypothetical protein